MLQWILTGVLITVLYLAYCRNKSLDHIVGPWFASFIPAYLTHGVVTGDIVGVCRKLFKVYGPLVKTSYHTVGLMDIDEIHTMLAKKAIIKKLNTAQLSIVKYGLPFVSDPQQAEKYRKMMLQGALNADVLRHMKGDQFIINCVDPMIARIRASVLVRPLVDIQEESFHLTKDVISSALFHINPQSKEVQISKIFQTGPNAWARLKEVILHPFILKFVGSSSDPQLDKFLDHIHETAQCPLMTIYRESDLNMEEQKIQLNTLWMAGTDTSAFALHTIMILLSKHSIIQDKVRTLVMDNFDSLSDMTYETIMERIPYVRAVVYEGLRYMAPIPLLKTRVNPLDDMVICDQVIPAHTNINIPLDVAMNPNGKLFDPERYDKEKHMYIPFGKGPRSCPGMKLAEIELITCVPYLVANFVWTDPTPEIDLDAVSMSFINRYYSINYKLEVRDNK
jgi:cytochrome P450